MVRVQLEDCEIVDALGFEETLPDGRVVESSAGRDLAGVRLHLRLENLTGRTFVVAACHGALAVVPEHDPRPPCLPFPAGEWTLLAPHGTLNLYPTLTNTSFDAGVIVERLRPGGAIIAWPEYVPDPVSFELSPAGCRALDAKELTRSRSRS